MRKSFLLKTFCFSVAIFGGFSLVQAQVQETEIVWPVFPERDECLSFQAEQNDGKETVKESENSFDKEFGGKKPDFQFTAKSRHQDHSNFDRSQEMVSDQMHNFAAKYFERNFEMNRPETLPKEFPAQEIQKEKFHWKPALIQSGIFLSIQHGFRLLQKKTVRELDGPFFRDWGKSVRGLRGWRDGDSELVNYIAHPLQGGVTGRIFINNSDNAKKQEFSKSSDYWKSRFKTFVWSAAWSTQFEMGPFSEATIGNVGIREKDGYSPMAWVDLIITPVVGTGVVIGEDAIDRYILKNWLEKKRGYRVTTTIKFLRTLLTPTTSVSNILRGKLPWKRDTR